MLVRWYLRRFETCFLALSYSEVVAAYSKGCEDAKGAAQGPIFLAEKGGDEPTESVLFLKDRVNMVCNPQKIGRC